MIMDHSKAHNKYSVTSKNDGDIETDADSILVSKNLVTLYNMVPLVNIN